MNIELYFNHESYLDALTDLREHDFWVAGGDDYESPAEDFRNMIGTEPPGNLYYESHPNPDLTIQGDNPDIEITHNRWLEPDPDVGTVVTTEGILARALPENLRPWTLIHHGVDIDTFDGWKADMDRPIVTAGNNIRDRPKAFDMDVFDELMSSDFQTAAWGRGNPDGLISRSDFIEGLQRASIFVNCSKTIIPHALLEAMAVGMPVITVESVGILDAITPMYNGIIVDSPEQVTQAVTFLRDNPDQAAAFGQRARRTIKGSYTRERFVKQWDNLFRSVR